MKTGQSSLNPYAASYVPLSKRGATDENKDFNSSPKLQSGSVLYGHPNNNSLTQGQLQKVSQSYAHNADAFQPAGFSKQKDHRAHEPYGSSSHYPNETPERSNFDEEFVIDLEFLRMRFPGISEESLHDVYLVNNFDLDAAIDMMNQLELYPDDSPNKLPDTLDIGDVPESGPSSFTSKGGASKSGSSS